MLTYFRHQTRTCPPLSDLSVAPSPKIAPQPHASHPSPTRAQPLTSTVATAAKPDKPPGYRFGRPTDYRPEYCDAIVEDMAKGLSKTAFAASIGVARFTLLEWANRHPDFHDAMKRAEAARVRALELQMLDADSNAKVVARIFALKNADPEEWRDRQEFYTRHEHVLHPSAILAEIARTDPDTAKLLASRFGVDVSARDAVDVTPIEAAPDPSSGDGEG